MPSTPRRHVWPVVAVCAALLVGRPALGEEPQAAPPSPSSTASAAPAPVPPPPPPVVRVSSGTWGWYVLASGVAVGAAVTAYGFTIDCSETDLACRSRASLGIWGGIGIAAIASALGLAVVQAGRVQVAPAVTAEALPRAGVVVRGTF